MEELRRRINEIDAEIVKLFRERMKTVEGIAEYKKEHGIGVYDPSREASLLARISELAGDDLAPDARELFGTILEISKRRQRTIVSRG